MTRDMCCYRLAPLASLNVQRRFIINATKDEYLLIEELLDEALGIERLINVEQSDLSRNELECLVSFVRELKGRIDSIMQAAAAETVEQLIERNEDWSVIRSFANTCLRTMMFDLGSWEHEQLSLVV